MRLRILRKDINRANEEFEALQLRSRSCPIFQALKRVGLDPEYVSSVASLYNGQFLELHKDAIKLMTDWDLQLNPMPQTVTLTKISQLN